MDGCKIFPDQGAEGQPSVGGKERGRLLGETASIIPDFAMEARQQVWMVHPDAESSDG
jgi:hypothetical protein